MAKTLATNAPEALGGVHRGAEQKVTLPETAARREILRDMLANGIDKDRIRAEMAARFEMTDASVNRLIDEVRTEDAAEAAEEKKNYKRYAMRRLLRTIAKANVSRQYSAAAKAEEILMRIQGTEEAREIADVDAVVAGALVRIVARMDPQKARAIIRQRTLRQIGPPAGSLPSE